MPPTGRCLHAAQLVCLYEHLALESREYLVSVGLDRDGWIVCEARLAGTATGVVARPAELLAPVLRAGGIAMALVHNHPSGQAQPSAADIAFTRRMSAAARIVGVRLVDHVIIASCGWSSLARLGHLSDAQEEKQ